MNKKFEKLRESRRMKKKRYRKYRQKVSNNGIKGYWIGIVSKK